MVRGHCRGGHAIIYGAMLQDRGIIYEVSGSKSGLSALFSIICLALWLLTEVGVVGNERPGQKLPVELARVRAVLRKPILKREIVCQESVRHITANQRPSQV